MMVRATEKTRATWPSATDSAMEMNSIGRHSHHHHYYYYCYYYYCCCSATALPRLLESSIESHTAWHPCPQCTPSSHPPKPQETLRQARLFEIPRPMSLSSRSGPERSHPGIQTRRFRQRVPWASSPLPIRQAHETPRFPLPMPRPRRTFSRPMIR